MMSELISHKMYTIILLAIVGGVTGTVIILYDAGATAASQAFISTPEFPVWLMLIIIHTTFFAIIIIPLFRAVKRMKNWSTGNKVEISLSAGLITLLFFVGVFVPRYYLDIPRVTWPLAHHEAKMLIITVLAYIVTLLAILGILLVHIALRSTFQRVEPQENQVQAYLHLRKSLQQFFTILGVMIGLAVLATGALRRVILAMGVAETAWPSSLILMYGAYFTLLLALVYIPVYNRLLSVGQQLVEAFTPLPLADTSPWSEMYGKRQKLEEYLQTRLTAEQNFRTGITIFSPLLSAIISTLIG